MSGIDSARAKPLPGGGFFMIRNYPPRPCSVCGREFVPLVANGKKCPEHNGGALLMRKLRKGSL